MQIQTSRNDVVWNYIGTLASFCGSFLLLPILLRYLSDDDLGLWYVFLAISNLTQLFEFGFNPTFSRNLVYCFSGAKELRKEGPVELGTHVDSHLTAAVLKTVKLVYAGVASAALIMSATAGSAYIAYVTRDMGGISHWISWVIVCVSTFLNLYYLWTLTYLRGIGDIVGENRSKTIAKLFQIVLTFVLCAIGLSLVGAVLGMLANGVVLRLAAKAELKKHQSLFKEIAESGGKVSLRDVKVILRTVSYLSLKDGMVQFSLYASTQATSLIGSAFLSLSDMSMYSLQAQLANALGSFSSVFIASYYPNFQSAFARDDSERMRTILERGLGAFWLCAVFGCLGIIGLAFPLIVIFRPTAELSIPLFSAMAIYTCALQQYSVCCSLIASTNRIPYLRAFVVSAISGIALSTVFVSAFNMGFWGLIFGQFISQALYNYWRWPLQICQELQTDLPAVLKHGLRWWVTNIKIKIMQSFK